MCVCVYIYNIHIRICIPIATNVDMYMCVCARMRMYAWTYIPCPFRTTRLGGGGVWCSTTFRNSETQGMASVILPTPYTRAARVAGGRAQGCGLGGL